MLAGYNSRKAFNITKAQPGRRENEGTDDKYYG
jgi:hypothetical protein